MYAEVYLTLLTCCFSIDIYSFLYRTQLVHVGFIPGVAEIRLVARKAILKGSNSLFSTNGARLYFFS